MTSLLKRNLHEMVDYAESDKVISACIGREDVCRFLLHSFMDYMTDHGFYDSSFQVLIDWSQQLNVYVDDKEWKVKKQSNITNNTNTINSDNSNSNLSPQSNHSSHNILHPNSPPFAYNSKERSFSNSSTHGQNHHRHHSHKHSNSFKRRKKTSKKRARGNAIGNAAANKHNIRKLCVDSKPPLTPSSSLPVTPMSDTNNGNHIQANFHDGSEIILERWKDEDEKLQSPKVKSVVPINNKMPSLTITQTRWIDENETESDHDTKENTSSKPTDSGNNNKGTITRQRYYLYI